MLIFFFGDLEVVVMHSIQGNSELHVYLLLLLFEIFMHDYYKAKNVILFAYKRNPTIAILSFP